MPLERKLQHDEDEDHGLDTTTLAASVSRNGGGIDLAPSDGHEAGQGPLAQTVRLLVSLHMGDGLSGESSSSASLMDQLDVHHEGDVLLVISNPDASSASASSASSSSTSDTAPVAIHAAHSCILSARSGVLRRMLQSSHSLSPSQCIACRYTVLDLTSVLPKGTGYLIPLVLDYLYCGDGPAAGYNILIVAYS